MFIATTCRHSSKRNYDTHVRLFVVVASGSLRAEAWNCSSWLYNLVATKSQRMFVLLNKFSSGDGENVNSGRVSPDLFESYGRA